MPERLRDDLARLARGACPTRSTALLDADERDAVLDAGRRAWSTTARFPDDHSGRRYPWPLV